MLLMCSYSNFAFKPASLNRAFVITMIVAFVFSLGGLGVHSAQATSAPAGIVFSVPITIANTQSVATAAPFQQMITVNSAAYSSLEASNLLNVEFFDSSGNVIPSWLESGNANTATNTVYWIKIAEGIPADSSMTVYLGFASLSTNLFNAQTIGEAPKLSPVFGEYDNGATVFIYYTNFAGTSLPSGWTVYDPNSITYFVNNGLTVTNSVFVSGGDPQIYYTNSLSNPYNTVIDAYMNVNSGPAEFLGYLYGPNGASQDTCVGGDNDVWSIHNFDGGTGSSTSMGAGSLDSNWHVLSYFPSTSAGNGWLDYTHFTTYSGNFNFVDSKPGLFGEGTYQQTASAQWFRQRALPPEGLMPSVNVLSTPSPTTPSSTATPATSGLSLFQFVIVIGVVAVVVVGGVGFLALRNRQSKRKAAAIRESVSATVASSLQVTAETLSSSTQTSGVLSPEAIQKLQQLKEMLDKGLITQKDFDEQKKKILSNP